LVDVPLTEATTGLAREYPRQEVFGVSADYYWDRIKTVLRFEGGYFPDMSYQTAQDKFLGVDLPPNCHGTGLTPVQESDAIHYMIGFDRPTMIRFINPHRSTFITGQIFHRWVLDHEDNMAVAFYPVPVHELSQMYTLSFTTGYKHDTILPLIAFGYDPRGNGMIQAWCDFIPAWNENMRFRLLGVTFMGNDECEGLGLFLQKDYISLESTFSW
jgi:hypothetical protein